jgi:hypothetical protein
MIAVVFYFYFRVDGGIHYSFLVVVGLGFV